MNDKGNRYALSALKSQRATIASEIVSQRKQSNVDRHPPLASIVSMPRPVVRSMSAETGQLAAIARRVGTFSAAQPCERNLNNFIGGLMMDFGWWPK